MKKRLMALALVAIIAIAGVAGYTLAWLQDTTETVTNTFTEGKVDIDLWEYDYIQSSNSLDTTKKVTSAQVRETQALPVMINSKSFVCGP